MLRLIFALIWNSVVAICWPLFALRRARAAPKSGWLHVEVWGAVEDMGHPLSRFRQGKTLDLHALRRSLAWALEDDRVVGVLVTLHRFRRGTATAKSLRDLLCQVRSAGKRTCVYLPNGAGTREFYVASAAERVLVEPEARLRPLGFAVEQLYFKQALDRAGIEPDVLARGTYKTAGEPLVRDSMSDAQREQIDRLLSVNFEHLVKAIAEGRNTTVERAERWIHEGPWSAQRAVEQGLVDALCHQDEVPTRLSEGEDEKQLVGIDAYARRRQVPWRALRRPACIAVIRVHGAIASESVRGLSSEQRFKAEVTQARENKRVKGVLVHVDSRGGSALASARMHRELSQLALHKPVVAYFGDTAASGGYMIGVAARSIVAQPVCVTGSIGVVFAMVRLGTVLERLGVRVQGVKRGERADMFSASRPLSSDERRALESELDETYESFLRTVAEGRSRKIEEIKPLAGGRVWSGLDAHRQGLVDSLGGFDHAIGQLRQHIGPGAERLEPVLVAPRRQAIAELLPFVAWGDRIQNALARFWPLLDAGSHGGPLAWCEIDEVEQESAVFRR